MDDFTRKHFPNIIPYSIPSPTIPIGPNREDFDALKKEVEELKEELKKARAKDIEDSADDCSIHKESVQIIKDLAEKLGVDLEDVLDGHK